MVYTSSFDKRVNELCQLHNENHLLMGRIKNLNKDISKLNKFHVGTKKRHQHPVGLPGLTRKHPEFVPDMWRARGYQNDKINSLLKLGKGKHVCSPTDIKYIKNTFKVDTFLPSDVKKLGNTGITLYYDPQIKKFIMER